MTVVSVTSASVGTKLATASDTKITGITMTQPSAAATADMNTPLILADLAAAPTGIYRTLFAAAQAALSYVFGVKPAMPMTPSLTAPTWPQSISGAGYPMGFTNGVFVISCPAGVTFSVTTG